MARPQKNSCDYFTHDNDMRNHRKVRSLRNKFGINGYAIWSMLLEYLNGFIYSESLNERLYSRFENIKSKGEHWNWKGGITNDNLKIRNSSEMKNWRIKVFQRDKYTCQVCHQKGGKLQAHHINKFSTHPELRFKISNGLTVCIECHKLIHAKK